MAITKARKDESTKKGKGEDKNMEKRILTGVKEIASHTKRSWPTVHTWIQRRHFPARKLDGVWMAYTDRIDLWLQDQIDVADQSTK